MDINKPQIPFLDMISQEEWEDIVCAGLTRVREYKKNDQILQMGETTREMGILLSGSVNIENIDIWGTRTILSNIEAGHVFAETYAITGQVMMVGAAAAAPCRVLFLNVKKMLSPAFGQKSWRIKAERKLLMICARKNLVLSRRFFYTTSKSIRGRLMMYFSNVSPDCKSREFDIPFNRQQLAEYLNLDRSALSKELGRMRDEGMIEFHKNHFILKESMEV